MYKPIKRPIPPAISTTPISSGNFASPKRLNSSFIFTENMHVSPYKIKDIEETRINPNVTGGINSGSRNAQLRQTMREEGERMMVRAYSKGFSL